jgi:peptidylprolyl isomerase
MFNRFEIIGIGASVAIMAVALYFIRLETTPDLSEQIAGLANSGVVVVEEGNNQNAALANAIIEASDGSSLQRLIIDDVVIGTGAEVKDGDVVEVHYIGTLQNGQEFDNSRSRGETFSFKVGSGDVILGWDEGIKGMKVGGQRILVIPSELGYGSRGFGPIPGGATLVFAIELLSIE